MGTSFKHVFVIGADGAGAFVRQTETPNIDGLFREGASTYSAQTAFPSISAQCWGALHHGVTPEKHGLDNDVVANHPYPDDSPYPSFMKLARQAWPDCKLAAFSEWQPINGGIIEEGIGVHKVSLPDAELASAAADYIRNNKDIKIMFVEFSDPDAAGHKYGYGSKEFLDVITVTDGHIGTLLEAIRDAGLLDDSLIILTTDHGGAGDYGYYSHGSDHPNDMLIYWGCRGPGIAPGTQLGEVRIYDTTAVVLRALGLPIPDVYDGRVPALLFE